MGLKERRFAKQFAEEQFPALEAKIKEAIGFEVPLEIAWETLFEEQFLHLYNDTYPKIYFIPFIEAFKIIGKDQIGKEALQEGIQRIEICNENNHHNPDRAYSLENGILKLDHSPVLNAEQVDDRIESLVKLLENQL